MTALSFIRLISNTVAFLMLLFCKKNTYLKSESFRSSRPEVFFGEGILKIGAHPCGSVIQ